MVKVDSQLRTQIRQLRVEGHSLTEIKKTLGVSKPTIIKYSRDLMMKDKKSTEEEASLSHIPPEIDQEEENEQKFQDAPPKLPPPIPRLKDTSFKPPQHIPRLKDVPPDPPPPINPNMPEDFAPHSSPEEATIEVKGIPVGRKILLTPKNLTMFQWFKSKYQFGGDLSDFINDTMEYFFRIGVRAKMQVVTQEELS